MIATEINYEKIYENLGYLFYAIAASDEKVRPEEIQKLKTVVAKEWLPLEDSIDKYGTDAAHYISIAFDYLLNEGTSPDDAFTVFSDYYQLHSAAFSKDLKRKISKTASAIADSFAHRNKNEQKFITKLQHLIR
ncbi:hypothetical protein [Chryseolinea sp. H1M3-3]|uniref:hypothetical protein n=1 Tax=Chryseolinea sp. H1M3-3 TaxID=3034144 RepID=UPI0023EC6BBD|nr:hypothetical protein [Chryseolinea sp. H1M3-3]